MVPSLRLLSCDSSVSVKNPDRKKKIRGNRSWLIHLILEAVIPYEDDTEDLKIQRNKHFLNHNIGSDKSCKCWKTCKSISPKNLFTIFWLATKRFTALTCPPRYFNDAWQNTNFNGSTYNVIINNTEQKMKVFIKDFFSKCDQIRSFLRIWLHLLENFLISG